MNALTQFKALTATLTSSASDDVKSYDLVWLIHLVGDAHRRRMRPLASLLRIPATMAEMLRR